jgi:hypothetical protein
MASSRITKQKITEMIELRRKEILKKREFINRLKATVQSEATKISELEGAILALHELLTGQKVE